jgi:hypothetical protein
MTEYVIVDSNQFRNWIDALKHANRIEGGSKYNLLKIIHEMESQKALNPCLRGQPKPSK